LQSAGQSSGKDGTVLPTISKWLLMMPACLNVAAWRLSKPAEMFAFLGDGKASGDKRNRFPLTVRTHLRPVDVYAYLRARFGQPNGFQNLLRKESCDNLIHWGFFLWAESEVVYLSGASREIQIMVTEDLSDGQWKELINNIKSDFARVAREKSAIMHSFEKYVMFQNKYVVLADLCADLHANIEDTPPAPTFVPLRDNEGKTTVFEEVMAARSKRMQQLFGDCLKLRLLMPVMAEAYINMLILTFCRSAIRDDQARYDAFLRTNIPQRLELLNINCDGFARAVDKTLPGWDTFMRIVNRRNFELHGNVNPTKDQIEVVYFEGRRPLFVNPGHNIHLLFEQMEKEADPRTLLQEYVELHGFLAAIGDCLTARHKEFFEHVISDAYPGFEVRKRRPTRLLPDHCVWHAGEGTRYDDELDVKW
jgi:hypothetical protein